MSKLSGTPQMFGHVSPQGLRYNTENGTGKQKAEKKEEMQPGLVAVCVRVASRLS